MKGILILLILVISNNWVNGQTLGLDIQAYGELIKGMDSHFREELNDYGYSGQFWQNWANYEIIELMKERVENKKDLERVAGRLEKGFGIKSFVDMYFSHEYSEMIYDDKQWLALSLVALHEQNPQLLSYAERLVEMIEEYNMNYDSQGNYLGLFWEPGNYPNAVTNELFLVLCLRLYKVTGTQKYLEYGLLQFKWLFKPNGIYVDGQFLDGYGHNNNTQPQGGIWSYNQGIVLEGLGLLTIYDSVNTQDYLNRAKEILQASIDYYCVREGDLLVMQEYSSTIDYDTHSIFRGIFFRHLLYLGKTLKSGGGGGWDWLNREVPLLKQMVVDNGEAVSRFSDLAVSYDWTQISDHHLLYGNQMCLVYVLMANHELYGHTNQVVQGASFKCDDNIYLQLSTNYSSVSMIYLDTQFQFSPQDDYQQVRLPNFCQGNVIGDHLIFQVTKLDSSVTLFHFFHSDYSTTNLTPQLSPSSSLITIAPSCNHQITTTKDNVNITFHTPFHSQCPLDKSSHIYIHIS